MVQKTENAEGKLCWRGRSDTDPNQQGFTLVELMISIAIIGVLTVLVSGQYRGMVQKAKRLEFSRNSKTLTMIVSEHRGSEEALPWNTELNEAGASQALGITGQRTHYRYRIFFQANPILPVIGAVSRTGDATSSDKLMQALGFEMVVCQDGITGRKWTSSENLTFATGMSSHVGFDPHGLGRVLNSTVDLFSTHCVDGNLTVGP
jgi:prepilin-type N-terminal cleavage/methylation domain-containing protein